MREPTPDRWRLAAAGAQLLGVAVMAAIYAPQPLLAAIAREFGRSAFEANLVVSMTTLGIAVGVFPAAWLAERAGRGAVIAASLGVGVVLTALTASATEWPVLVASRLLAGVVLSGVLVSALVWSSEAAPAMRRRRVAAMYVAGTTAGGMAGRIVAGVVAEWWGWRAGVIAVDALVLAASVGGVLAVAAMVRRRRRAPESGPVPVVRRVGRGVRARLFVVAFAGMAAFMGVFNAIAFRVHEPPFSLGLGVTSLLFLTYAAGTVSSMRTGALLDRIGVRTTILLGAGIMAAGAVLLLVEHVAAVIAGLLVLAAGFFMLHTGASATVPSVSPRPSVGQAWYTLFYYAGSSAGALLLGWAWDVARWPAVTLAAMLLVGVAALATLGLPRRSR
ncbi:MFS transporter [Microbacterium marinilacus]|uniref:MFS transporter n=1 Tax=Microbacterium marinilacus TaxID=415209 RepID=A0ABP7BH69_9MICO|nr:MFS transporter [Microbacterium marinilacus]MBY0690150.1 MFS transporter [Microbacterium marinilacus]